uniref:Lysozyme inhibitor LprI N-terminal domain-containing protein n=1 Tax=Magnetococcus massalia (strain MO-1) TaxID=451514 RepID=A0A1S7LMT1_MAGMO|nr:exported protein of unknown function [Candidatus Magnetococcus massalia]
MPHLLTVATALLLLFTSTHVTATPQSCSQAWHQAHTFSSYDALYHFLEYETRTLCATKHPFFSSLDKKSCEDYSPNLSYGRKRMARVVNSFDPLQPKLALASRQLQRSNSCEKELQTTFTKLSKLGEQHLQQLQPLKRKAEACLESYVRLNLWCKQLRGPAKKP